MKTEFGLSAGLADASKVKIKRKVFTQGKHGNAKVKEVEVEEEVHRVQVLDPATGTGTFLAEVVRQVHAKFEGQAGMWPQYVEQHLIPRLNGFELLMASYAMAHLKLDLVLRDTGYDMGQPHGTPKANSTGSEQQRLRVFLTNSLEEAHPETGTLFASWLSQEANEANAVKRETPVMVVLGNPPYSGHSSNNGEWISDLVRDYYQEPSGGPLQERTTKWLNDDYVKFIRFGEHFIENTGEGVLAYINNHSFLDNPTFRGMRWHLLNTFDKIHVIDLHGNSKKKEVAPDGGKDENVFDIIQGVSVNLFVRTGKKKKGQLGCLYHTDVWGTREVKYDSLSAKSHSSFTSRLIEPRPPFYFFLPVDNEAAAEYERCLELPELFALNNVGMTTAHDEFVVDDSKATLQERFTRFKSRPANAVALHTEFDVREKAGWNIIDGWTNLQRTENLSKLIEPLTYRPFDNRYILYEQKLVWRTGHKVMQHFQHGANIAILLGRQGQVVGGMEWNLAYITNMMTDFNLFYRGGVLNLPLYLYPETTKQTSTATQSVQPNLDAKLVEQLAKGIGLTFTFNPEALFAHGAGKELTPLDVLDYCYAVLHSPAYRVKYKEFLKSDFPRIPFPTDAKKFRALVQLGAKLRQLHLLEWDGIDKYITTYPAAGSNEVTRKMSKSSIGFELTDKKNGLGRVWINDEQYFDGVPEAAWNFYIGGYQPAQKWLKDRHGRTLTFDDIRHYQRMIVALTETGKVMEEVDKVGVVSK